jgi:hypothetical protein
LRPMLMLISHFTFRTLKGAGVMAMADLFIMTDNQEYGC